MTEWHGTVVLTTPRLLLRTFRRGDLPHYAALNADPEVVRYLGGVPLTREHSDELAEWAQECWAREGPGLLAVERRSWEWSSTTRPRWRTTGWSSRPWCTRSAPISGGGGANRAAAWRAGRGRGAG
jgi:hypothetical protein